MTKTSNQKPKKKVGKKAAQTIKREEYFPKLKALIESVGEWNINYKQLEREWGVPDSTLIRWRDKIFEEIGPIDVTQIGREICRGAESNLKNLQRMFLKESSTSKKLLIIKTMNDTAKSLTDFLEAYNYKIKVSEKIDMNMSSEPISINIIRPDKIGDQDD